MMSKRNWSQYQSSYRTRELKILTGWMINGNSGTVTGLPGVGKSNLLGYLCHRPDIVQSYLAKTDVPVALIPLDLNNLPDNTNATFYRIILRSFYEIRDNFEQSLQQIIISKYLENKAIRDPFLVQTALREILIQFRDRKFRVGFVFDRFEAFSATAPKQLINALRGLRDSFKDILFYIIGMRQEVAYIPDPTSLGELYELLDINVCWVWPMNHHDASTLILQETALSSSQPAKLEIEFFLRLSGGFPSLLKTICSWWGTTDHKHPLTEWGEILVRQSSIIYRLQEIINGLTQEELMVLQQIHLHKNGDFADRFQPIILSLKEKGICHQTVSGWQTSSQLLSKYLSEIHKVSRGRIRLDVKTGEIYHGHEIVPDLTPIERSVLLFLLEQPWIRHTKTDLIVNTWPDELKRRGVTDDSLYQIIAGLRRKIEPIPSKPCYLINWRGKPEGGYQLFPEGRPR